MLWNTSNSEQLHTANLPQSGMNWAFIQLGDFQPVYTEVIGIQNRSAVLAGRDINGIFGKHSVPFCLKHP